MDKKWHGVVLTICIVLCAAGGITFCFKDIFWQDGKPDSAVAASAGSEETEAPADTAGTEENTTGQAEATTETEITTEETLVEEETGYNGDDFKDNGLPYCIKVNRKMNVVTIYTLDDEGYYTIPYKAMVCSVGVSDKTPRGTFHLQSDRYEWRELVGRVYGQYAVRIKNSIMFHSVPYYSPQKDQLESEEYNKLGQAASKGCIRLSVADSKWIYDNCDKGTIVQIFDSDYIGPLGKPDSITLNLQDERSCYDPTDETEDNPWNENDTKNDTNSFQSTTTKACDEAAPEISLKADAPQTLTTQQATDVTYLESLIEVTDESDIAEMNVSLPLSVGTNIVYRVVYTAKDAYGNVATAYYAFKIQD